jgi:hypothetical protein
LPPTVLLIIDGDQVPTMPLGDVVFKVGAVVPEQSDKVAAKLGIIFAEVTVTTVVKLLAH